MSIQTTNPTADVTDRSTRQLGGVSITDSYQDEYLPLILNEVKRTALLVEQIHDNLDLPFYTGRIYLTRIPDTLAALGVINLGDGGFYGTGVAFAGSTSGTYLAGNALSTFTGSLIDLQLAGSSRFKVDYNSLITTNAPSGYTSNLLNLQLNGVSKVTSDYRGWTQFNNSGRTYVNQTQLNVVASFAGDGISVIGDSNNLVSPTFDLYDLVTTKSQFGVAFVAGHFSALAAVNDVVISSKNGNLILDSQPTEASTVTIGTASIAKLILKGNDTSSSGSATLLNFTPKISQSSTAGYTAFLVNVTESSTGSGTKLLLDTQVGSASKFSVNNAGAITNYAAAAPTNGQILIGSSSKYNSVQGPWINFTANKFFSSVASGTSQPANGIAVATPFFMSNSFTTALISVNVTAGGTAGSVTRLGIYNDNAGLPGTVLADFGTVATTTTGIKSIAGSFAITPGLYWLVAVTQGAPATAPIYTGSIGSNGISSLPTNAVQSTTATAYTNSGTTGALPTWTGTTANFLATGIFINLQVV